MKSLASLSSIFARPLIGLDIGTSGIKAVEISGKKTPRLAAYNRIPLPPGVISPDGEIKNPQFVVAALKRLFSVKNFSSKKVAVGAFGNSVITKKITVPKMSEKDLQNQLYWEAEQYIPFNVADVNLDFAILGNNAQMESSTPMMDVLLVVAKKDYIQSLVSLIEEAGLQPEVIDNQAFALGNAFEFNYSHLIQDAPQAVYGIIDLGAGSTKVSIVEGDKTCFARELRFCGSHCTQMIAEGLKVDWETAEAEKLTEAPSAPANEIISAFIKSLVDELSRTFDFYASQAPDRSLQEIYICGGTSRLNGLFASLEERMPVPVRKLNPIQNVAGSGERMNAEALRELAYLGAVAVGLSLRSPGDTK